MRTNQELLNWVVDEVTKRVKVDATLTGSTATKFEQIVVSSSAAGVGLTPPAGATKAVIGIEANEIRFRLDGQAPTAAIGHYGYVSDMIVLRSAQDIANFKAIRAGAADATLNVTYSQ